MTLDDAGSIDNVGATVLYIADELNENVAEEIDAIWQKIRDLAIDLCPKETGALASSITLENESGSSGAISVSGTAGGSGGEFYSNSIQAGDSSIINPISGDPTDLYALFVHDGHGMPNGGFYEGVPFLADAVDSYQNDLDSVVDYALDNMGISDSEE